MANRIDEAGQIKEEVSELNKNEQKVKNDNKTFNEAVEGFKKFFSAKGSGIQNIKGMNTGGDSSDGDKKKDEKENNKENNNSRLNGGDNEEEGIFSEEEKAKNDKEIDNVGIQITEVKKTSQINSGIGKDHPKGNKAVQQGNGKER